MIGKTISHYRILEQVGQGGMGVVYKAHDLTLDRDVALKFLPHDVSSSPEERSRFIHEAKAASALDHPNICTIYESGETPDGQLFIAMGYYEGTSLSKRIEKGQIELAEAVWIASQVAEGLQAAHSKGIVHRDIKSTNIIVTDSGQVKILDFGLAHRTGLSKLTKTGSTVGTAAYMSPEQARGEKLDLRSDLWSLGVVLYEMVTGKLPFRGDHEPAILYSVVNEQPQPIQTFLPDASPELIHIIRRALEKEPSERYQSAADMLIDLRRLKKDTSRTGFVPVSGERKSSLSSEAGIAAIIGSIILFCVVGYLYVTRKTERVNPNFTQRIIQIPMKKTSGIDISPDGKWVAFGAEDEKKIWDLYVMSIGGGEARRLTSDFDSNYVGVPNFSRDGSMIVYQRGTSSHSEICIVPFLGGTSRKIEVGTAPKWSPDGEKIGYLLGPAWRTWPRSKSGHGEFWTISPDGTHNRLEFVDTIAANTYSVFSFAFSPDGGAVAWVRQLPNWYCEIVVHDLKTHAERKLVSDPRYRNGICWGANNEIIYSSTGIDGLNLWAISPDGGTPIQITRGANNFDSPRLSADGQKVVFTQYTSTGRIYIADLTGSNKKTEILSEEGYIRSPAISPDGRFISYGNEQAIVPGMQLFIMNRDGSNRRQISTGNTFNFDARWSPNGIFIAFSSRGTYDPSDSFNVCLVNSERLDMPKIVHPGVFTSWRNSTTLELSYRRKMWALSVDDMSPKQFSADSIYALSVLDGRYVLFYDQHSVRDSLWKVCRSEDWDKNGLARSWTIWKGPTHGIVPNYGILYFKNKNELWRISFSDGKQERIPATFPDIDLQDYRVRITSDGKEMVYKTSEYVSKIGVIENLFK